MLYTYKTSTLNINGLTAPTKVHMLGDFLRTQNINILCLQKVSTYAISNIANYTTHLNIGTEGKGKAIITKEIYRMTNIRRIPTGRGISGRINGITTISLHETVGADRNRELDCLYSQDISFVTTRLQWPHNYKWGLQLCNAGHGLHRAIINEQGTYTASGAP
jgi:exonuclease III